MARHHLKERHPKSPGSSRDSSSHHLKRALGSSELSPPYSSLSDSMLCFTGCTPQDGRIHSPVSIGVRKGRREME